jgi:hypothetical protein
MELEKEKGKEEEGWEQQIEIVSWFRQTDVHRRGLHASDLWSLENEEGWLVREKRKWKFASDFAKWKCWKNSLWSWYINTTITTCLMFNSHLVLPLNN